MDQVDQYDKEMWDAEQEEEKLNLLLSKYLKVELDDSIEKKSNAIIENKGLDYFYKNCIDEDELNELLKSILEENLKESNE